MDELNVPPLKTGELFTLYDTFQAALEARWKAAFEIFVVSVGSKEHTGNDEVNTSFNDG